MLKKWSDSMHGKHDITLSAGQNGGNNDEMTAN